MRRKNLPLTRLASAWENWLVLGEMFFFLSFLQVEEMDEDQDEQLTVTELTVWIEKRQKEQVGVIVPSSCWHGG